jgi:hypothetical protein
MLIVTAFAIMVSGGCGHTAPSARYRKLLDRDTGLDVAHVSLVPDG